MPGSARRDRGDQHPAARRAGARCGRVPRLRPGRPRDAVGQQRQLRRHQRPAAGADRVRRPPNAGNRASASMSSTRAGSPRAARSGRCATARAASRRSPDDPLEALRVSFIERQERAGSLGPGVTLPHGTAATLISTSLEIRPNLAAAASGQGHEDQIGRGALGPYPDPARAPACQRFRAHRCRSTARWCASRPNAASPAGAKPRRRSAAWRRTRR